MSNEKLKLSKNKIIENGNTYYVVNNDGNILYYKYVRNIDNSFPIRKIYYKDKELSIIHREDGAAIECYGGDKEWWVDGKRHRIDGPAIEYKNGHKEWWVSGKRHRMDGPAIEFLNRKYYYLNGVTYSEQEYWKMVVTIKFGSFV